MDNTQSCGLSQRISGKVETEIDAIPIAVPGAMESEPSAHVPAIYVAKYNRFVDNILGKINNILRANYEPVTVKLTNMNTGSKSNKNKNKAKKKGNKNGSKKSVSRPIDVVTERSDNENNVEV
jgi:hypothetical protein